MRTLIVSGGNISDSFLKGTLQKYSFDYMIGVDGGLDFFYRHNVIPDVAIGDFDTIDHDTVSYFKQNQKTVVKTLQPEKDMTDTESAIDYAIFAGSSEIWVLGGTGTRLDHTLGNINSLWIAKERGVSCIILDEHNRIELVDKYAKIIKEQQYGYYVSFLPLTSTVQHITLKGFKYPLSDATLTIGNSFGVSNEIEEEIAEVSFSEGILIMIQSKD